MSGPMHDHPGIFPTLPPRTVDPDLFDAMVGPNVGTPWQTCWEFVMTHRLTDAEGAAFWTGANLIFESLNQSRLPVTP